MSSSRLQTTFTDFPVFLASTAASTAKSGNDFRPNAPPSNVTCTVTSSFFRPSACATASRAPCGPCVAAHTSALPSRYTASAAGGSIEARSEEHTSELQSRLHLVCRLLLEKKKKHNTHA